MKKLNKTILAAVIAAVALLPLAARAQDAAGAAGRGAVRGARQPASPPTKTTFLRLTGNANATLIEPVTLNANSRFVIIRTHPEHANNINGDGRLLVNYGYRIMQVNYYGKEQIFRMRSAASIRFAI
jgi:hypothetical protein